MSDDNIIKFRKPPKPAPQKTRKPLRVPPFLIVILAAAVLGAVTYVMDQGKAATPPAPQTLP